jgi:proline dehydrogenase
MKETDGIEPNKAEDSSGGNMPNIDLSDVEIAFAGRSNEELKKRARILSWMNRPWLTRIGPQSIASAFWLRFSLAEETVRKTIFEQFAGGRTLLECRDVIDRLARSGVKTALDCSPKESKTEEDFNLAMNQVIRAIEFASQDPHIPFINLKITCLARFELLESFQRGDSFTNETRLEYKTVLKRLDSICHVANRKGIGIFFDAAESWVQDTIDHLAIHMMRRYNRERVVVGNTFQMYRKGRLQFLIDSFNQAQKEGYRLGAKLTSGAFAEKESARARELNFPLPIHDNQEAIDDAFDTAIRFCIDNYRDLASCNASHNARNVMLQVELTARRSITPDHPHLSFSQPYGMHDNLTFNLAKAGFNVAKSVPYGSVRDIIIMLMQGARENTSFTSRIKRELHLALQELKRRGI